ncbi:2-dehydropantoate 2-reductase [Schizothecium vesticola]|uniref:2-dehydropantoate 2-reductase n=1 Tax=Schizothecium vesticola TaxID=314040 RepID=A0AA40FBW9_9PEZI|nr:2-dehydropantoate 2-reductase [Schizothecium vesticola]
MPTDTIHILGVGNLGKFVAHSLARDVARPVTLLFHREGLKEQWESEGSRITCITDAVAETTTDFGIEVLSSDTPTNQPEPNPHMNMIKNLVVTTKAYNIVSALSRIHHQLDPSSTILLLHNGMGTISEINTTLFPNPSSRPTLWTGITAAGIHSSRPFTIIRAGRGPLLLGPADPTTTSTQPLPTLIHALTRSPTLAPTVLSAPALQRAQLQKLVVNAVINPLTALSRCKNRHVAEDDTLRRLAGRLIAEEIGPVVRGVLGEQQQRDGDGEFSDEKLLERVLAVARETGGNTSSMLQDVSGGRKTEVGWINGFVVREGERLGMEVGMNQRLVGLVEAQRAGGGWMLGGRRGGEDTGGA